MWQAGIGSGAGAAVGELGRSSILDLLAPLDYPRQALYNLVRGPSRLLSGEGDWSDVLGMVPGLVGALSLPFTGGLGAAAIGGLTQGLGKATGMEAFSAATPADLVESVGGDRGSLLQTLLAGIATDPLTYAGGFQGARMGRGTPAGVNPGPAMHDMAGFHSPAMSGITSPPPRVPVGDEYLELLSRERPVNPTHLGPVELPGAHGPMTPFQQTMDAAELAKIEARGLDEQFAARQAARDRMVELPGKQALLDDFDKGWIDEQLEKYVANYGQRRVARDALLDLEGLANAETATPNEILRMHAAAQGEGRLLDRQSALLQYLDASPKEFLGPRLANAEGAQWMMLADRLAETGQVDPQLLRELSRGFGLSSAADEMATFGKFPQPGIRNAAANAQETFAEQLYPMLEEMLGATGGPLLERASAIPLRSPEALRLGMTDRRTRAALLDFLQDFMPRQAPRPRVPPPWSNEALGYSPAVDALDEIDDALDAFLQRGNPPGNLNMWGADL